MVARGDFGKMVAYQGTHVAAIPIQDAVGKRKLAGDEVLLAVAVPVDEGTEVGPPIRIDIQSLGRREPRVGVGMNVLEKVKAGILLIGEDQVLLANTLVVAHQRVRARATVDPFELAVGVLSHHRLAAAQRRRRVRAVVQEHGDRRFLKPNGPCAKSHDLAAVTKPARTSRPNRGGDLNKGRSYIIARKRAKR